MKFKDITPLMRWTLRRMFLADFSINKISKLTGIKAETLSALKTDRDTFGSDIPVDPKIKEMREKGSSFNEMNRLIGQGPKYARWYLDEYKLSPSYLMDETTNKDLEQYFKLWIVKKGDLSVGMHATCLSERNFRDLIGKFKLRKWFQEWDAKNDMLDRDAQIWKMRSIINKENSLDRERISYFRRNNPNLSIAEIAMRTNRHHSFVYETLATELFKQAS